MPLTVGVIGLPELAGVLRDAGFDVVGGDRFPLVARKLADALDAFDDGEQRFPVVAASTVESGQLFARWLAIQTGRGTPVSLVALDGERVSFDPSRLADVIESPATVDDIVRSLGFPPLDSDQGELVVSTTGEVLSAAEAYGIFEDDDPTPTEEHLDGDQGVDPGVGDAPVRDDTRDDARDGVDVDVDVDVPDWALDESDLDDDTNDSDLDEDEDDDPWEDPEVVEPARPRRPRTDLVETDPSEASASEEPPRPAPRRTPTRPSGPTSGRVVRPPSQDPSQEPVGRPAGRGPRPGPTKTPVVVPPADRAQRPRPSAPPAHRAPQRPEPIDESDYDDGDSDEYSDDYDEPSALDIFDPPAPKASPQPPPPKPEADRRPRRRRMAHTDTPVVVVAAFKGGVGKTTMAMGLAQRAAEHGGKRVIVVDANRGQSDITTYLRLGRAKLPTIWDAARTGDPRKGFAQPSEINKARHARLEQIPFSLVLGPPPSKADPRVVTADVYREVIEVARRAADLVVLDTQIIEAHDTSGLIDGLVVPMLQSGGWAVTISDLSSASVKNAHAGTERFKAAGVPIDRLLLLLNRVDAAANLDLHELGNSFRDRATIVGSVTADAETIQAMNQGQIVSDAPDMVEVFDEILYRITADEVFDPAQHSGFVASGKGLLGRLFGRGR